MNLLKKSYLAFILIILLTVLQTGCATTEAEFQTDRNKNSNMKNSILHDVIVTPSEALDENEFESSPGIVEGDLVISLYYGNIDTVDGKVLYKIATKQMGEDRYVIDLEFYDNNSKELTQQLSYTLRDDFMPETVHNPLETADVNNDGSYDIIIDLGIYGKIKLALCYIYDPNQKGYIQLTGFDELMTPHYNAGYIYEELRGEFNEYGRNKYRVDGTKLVLVASLHATYGGSPNPIYTEKVLIDGKMVTTKKNVSAKEIDIKEWGCSLP
ncbi:XAC2610-related protein [Lachnoclostridium phytofermentans]|nr:hypothetical protein [Lachnoclostridium phytofermentans]